MNQLTSEQFRLQPLKRVPTLVDLQNLLSWLSTCEETYLLDRSREFLKQVVLPFGESPQHGLGITMSRAMPEMSPVWTYYRCLEPEAEVEWAYPSPDPSLIHNMLLCVFPNETFMHESNAPYAEVPRKLDEAEGEVWNGHRSGEKREAEKPSIVHGSLQQLQLDGLLQSLASSRVTGKLIMTSHLSTGSIFLDKGAPVHAELKEQEGHDAMLELLAWRVGDFEVYADEPAPKNSITRRIEALLLESATLSDFARYLDAANIDDRSVLERIPMSYSEYLERMKDAVPLDEELADAIASLIDGQRSLADIAWKLSVPRSKWVPVIYNFVKGQVVRTCSAKQTSFGAHQSLIKYHASQIAGSGLLEANTGLYTHAVFMFLLELEMTRAHDHRSPFSVILIAPKEGNVRPAEILFLIESVELIQRVTRLSDAICHVEESCLGIILPATSKAEAKIIARRILEQLALQGTRADGQKPLWLRIGGVTVPQDCNSVDELLIMALDREHSSVLKLA